MPTLNLTANSKKKLKIILCAAGVIVAMSLAATTPSLTRNSVNTSVEPGQAAALKLPPGHQKTESQQGGIDLSSQTSGGSAASGSYGLQGTTPPTPTSSDNSTGNTSSPPAPATTEPDVLYPVDPIPKCAYYKYPAGSVQPYNCPICETYPSADGSYMPCGCNIKSNVQVMCVNPSNL